MKKKYLFIIFVIIFFSSCTKHIKYLQDKKEKKGKDQTEFTNQPPEYKIQPYDYLYITIRTTNEEVNELFSTLSTSMNQNQGQNSENFYFTGYMVNDTGYIQVPILGDFEIKDKNIYEVRHMVEERTAEIVNDAIVNVRLTSFRVTFLGETGNGTMTFYQEKLNILEALSAVGGVTEYGDKTNIMIVRKQDSTYNTYRVDLTDRHLLEKKEFFLQPNDIVYVEPVKSKIFRIALSDISIFTGILTTTTSIITTILFFITLTNNNNGQ